MKKLFILPVCTLLLFTACAHENGEDDMDPEAQKMIDALIEDLEENPLEMDEMKDQEDQKDLEEQEENKDEPVADEPTIEDDTTVVFTDVASVGTYTAYYNGVIGNGKPSVLFFHAPWCPACKANNKRLEAFYGDGDYSRSTYKIDYDTATELRTRYGVIQQDTFVVIDGEGNKVSSKSFPSESALRAMIEG